MIVGHGWQQNRLRALQILRRESEVFLLVLKNLIGEVARKGRLKGKVEGPRKARRPLEQMPKKRPADPAACEHQTDLGFAGHETPISDRWLSNRPKMLCARSFCDSLPNSTVLINLTLLAMGQARAIHRQDSFPKANGPRHLLVGEYLADRKIVFLRPVG